MVGYSRLIIFCFTKTSSSWITGTLDQLHFKGERKRPQWKPERVIALQFVGCFWGVDQCANKQVLCKAKLFPFFCATLVWRREASQQQRARRPLIYNITSVVVAIVHQTWIIHNRYDDTCLMQYRRVDNRHLRGERGWEGFDPGR